MVIKGGPTFEPWLRRGKARLVVGAQVFRAPGLDAWARVVAEGPVDIVFLPDQQWVAVESIPRLRLPPDLSVVLRRSDVVPMDK